MDGALEGKVLLLEVLSGRILDLELSHGVRESRLNLLLLAALELGGARGSEIISSTREM